MVWKIKEFRMKILFLATYGDFLATFEHSNVELLLNLGYEVHCAADFETPKYNLKTKALDQLGVIRHQVKFSRSPVDPANLFSMKRLIQLIREEKFDVLDCHNAVISVFGRIAAKLCKVSFVVYTAHGFFFYRGSSLKKQVLFKPIEFLLAKWTDLLITINLEDFRASQRMHPRGTAVYVPGIGIDTRAISNLPSNRSKYLTEFGLPNDSSLFLMVGELIPRKNQESAIRAFARARMNHAYLLICGIGQERDHYQKLIHELDMDSQIFLLGYRLDAKELMKSVDIFVFPSIQEGLPVALMEAMASGLPCIASNIRGNTDLIDDRLGGWTFEPHDVDQLSKLMKEARECDFEKIANYNQNKILTFDISNVRSIMNNQYKHIEMELKSK